MRLFIAKLLLLVSGAVALVGCGVPGIPKPPSLDLPQPVADLRAVRKGESVYLSWTVPAETTDRLAVRHWGPTRICRSPDAAMIACANPVGEVPAPPLAGASPRKDKSAKAAAKMQAHYIDHLPRALVEGDPAVEDSLCDFSAEWKRPKCWTLERCPGASGGGAAATLRFSSSTSRRKESY